MKKIKSSSLCLFTRFSTKKIFLFIFVSAVFITSGFFVSTASASTIIDTDITVDTTLTSEMSPYIITNDIIVEEGATLTINPGVIVKLKGSIFIVFGEIKALGTEQDPIYFTSYYDDTVGGDTDNQFKQVCSNILDADGNPTGEQTCESVPVSPALGNWGSITVASSTVVSQSIFNNFVNKYSTDGLVIGNNKGSTSSVNYYSDSSISIFKSNSNTFSGLDVLRLETSDYGSASVADSVIHGQKSYGSIYVGSNGTLNLRNSKVEGRNGSYGEPPININTNSIASFDNVEMIGSGGGFDFSFLGVYQSSSINLKDSSITSVNNGIEVFDDSTVTSSGTSIQCKNIGIEIYDYSSLNLSGGNINCENIGVDVYYNSVVDITGAKITGATVGSGLSNATGLFIHDNDIGYDGVNKISKSEITGNNKGLVIGYADIIANQNNIHDNKYAGIYNFDTYPDTPFTYDFTNNYWGDPTGPKNTYTNPDGLGNSIVGYNGLDTTLKYIPFLPTDPLLVPELPTCCSSVLFLPGVLGSKLYEQVGIEDKELWVSLNDGLHEKLSLNNQGKSIDDIYTKNDTERLDFDGNETGIVDNVYGFKIYESFINDLKKWKNDEEIIKDYAFIPYDWRLSLDDIINNGKIIPINNLSYSQTQDFSESYILKKLEELQTNSLNGKVTIITHSNGGLVAKALIQKLKDTNNPLYEKIDKVILIAVPQIGTPEAFINLLHGTDIGPLGSLISNERSCQLAENMPAVYNLLPSSSYFTTVDPAYAADKLASFENKSFFDSQTSKYGIYISNEAEMKSYILGGDNRTKPTFSDSAHPNIGNSTLYDQAQSVHQMLDNWVPYKDTKVIQVAGWGEETLSGLDYKSYVDFGGNENLSYKPREVVDGDGTVVIPSALWMSDSNPNVERWWVDLKKNNYGLNTNRAHKDILEVPNLLNFIKSKVADNGFTDSEKIIVDNASTLISDDIRRLHYTLHSPLTLGVIDNQGRYTGMDPLTKQITEEIPEARYRKIGDVQFLSIPDNLPYTIKMQGYESGSFSLDIEKQTGNEVLESSSLQGIPSSTSTIATIEVVPNAPVSDSILKIDQNGDGSIDKTLQVKEGEVVIYDVDPPELKVTFDKDTKNTIFSAVDVIDKNPRIVMSKDSIILKDNAGNTTVVPFIRHKDKQTRLMFSYRKIIRNGIITNIPNTSIMYDWKERKGILTDLDTIIVIKGVEKYKFSYNKAKQMTTIIERNNKKMKITQRKGFIVVSLKTKGDELEVNY